MNPDMLRDLAAKATPGPWHVEVNDGDEWWFGGHQDDGSRGHEAVVRPTTGKPFDSIMVGGGDRPDELANAHLAALAPELAGWAADAADALEHARDSMQIVANGCDPAHLDDEITNADALLARLERIGQ